MLQQNSLKLPEPDHASEDAGIQCQLLKSVQESAISILEEVEQSGLFR